MLIKAESDPEQLEWCPGCVDQCRSQVCDLEYAISALTLMCTSEPQKAEIPEFLSHLETITKNHAKIQKWADNFGINVTSPPAKKTRRS